MPLTFPTVTSITGTTNQVVASAPVGPITLSLPQSIATASAPQFGKLGIGQPANSTVLVFVQGTPTNGASQYGNYFDVTTTSAATTKGVGCYGRAVSAAASYTVTDLQQDFHAQLLVSPGHREGALRCPVLFL